MMEKLNPKEINTTALAFIGDAVYEVFVREYVMAAGECRADRLHQAAVRYVKADAQAYAVKSLLQDFLTDDENCSCEAGAKPQKRVQIKKCGTGGIQTGDRF